MSEDERRVLEALEAEFDDKSSGESVLDQPWLGPAGWAALVLGLIATVGLLTTSEWLSFAGVIVAGMGLIMVHHSMRNRWSTISLRAALTPPPNRPFGESNGDEQ